MQHRGTALPIVILLAAVALVYCQSLRFDFVTWDDPANIFENPLFNPLDADNFMRIWTRPYFGMYAPISYTAWAGATRLGRDLSGVPFDPRVFHALNVLLHVGVVCLVLVILRRLGATRAAATAGALLFCVHPVQAEAVAWVTEARGLWAALFGCATIWLYLRGHGAEVVRDSIDGTLRPRQTPVAQSGRWHLAASVTLAAALMSKPSAVVLPVMLMVLDIVLFRVGWRWALLRVTDWLVLCVGWSLLSRWAQPATVLTEVTSAAQRPAIAADALAFYCRSLLWPFGLCAEYGRMPSMVLSHGVLAWLGVTVVLVVATAFLLANWRRLPAPVALFVVPLAPVLGFLPFHYQEISTVADRYLYLAMLGPALAVSWWLTERGDAVRWGATVAVLAAFAGVCAARTADWRNSTALWTRVLSINPRSAAANVNFGVVLLREDKLDEADERFKRAASLKPTLAQAHLGCGDVAMKRSQFSAARRHYQQAVECDARSVQAHISLASALLSEGDRTAAVAAYRQGLQLDMRQPGAANFLARLLATQEKGRQGAGIEAVKWAEWACQLTGYADYLALDTLAAAHAQAGQYAEAIRWHDQAVSTATVRGDQEFLLRAAPRRALYEKRQPLREKQLYVP